jgi:carboxymethylenebutenolidase
MSPTLVAQSTIPQLAKGEVQFFLLMLLTESHQDVPTTHGPMRVRIFKPTVDVPVPGIAVFTEIYQITGPVERFCRQICSQGYIVACPESYHEFLELGTVIAYDVAGTDLGNRLKITKSLDSYDQDATLVLNLLESLPECNGMLGSTGMCLGGHLAYRSAFDPRIQASVCYFPTDIHSETLGNSKSNSLERTKEIRGELIMIFGKQDNHIPLEGRNKIKKQLDQDKITYSWLELQAQHAFIRDEFSKGRYDPALAEQCFGFLKELFFRKLYLRQKTVSPLSNVC